MVPEYIPGARAVVFTLAVRVVLPDPLPGETLSQLPVLAATAVKESSLPPPRVWIVRFLGAGGAEIVPTWRKNNASGLTASLGFCACAVHPAHRIPTIRDTIVCLYGTVNIPFVRGGGHYLDRQPTQHITVSTLPEKKSIAL
ncbi:MAG: hypothetical protein A3J28_15625 [Acidobacteria bacterium RIFCSPLOWO2_12_FULL_60_22]|nr:MAG: hypothetical protein A3J28_15625 [Acidobacteria bacterium RIFCSPLOWO2_12_FULL_60_22]